MNANEIGKRLGIGLRVAGRIAHQRAEKAAPGQPPAPRPIPIAGELREIKTQSHKLTRAAGRGVGGFLRPFGRIGGILWLEVTGAFFGLFALFFAQAVWRARLSYASGPLHQRFLVAAMLAAVFAYLSFSSFWRARRR